MLCVNALVTGLIQWTKPGAPLHSSPAFPLGAHRCPPQRVEHTGGQEPVPAWECWRFKDLSPPGPPCCVSASAGPLGGSSICHPCPGAWPLSHTWSGSRAPVVSALASAPLRPRTTQQPSRDQSPGSFHSAALATFHFLEHTRVV